MTEFEFFDTNIILYAKIDESSNKHAIAKELVEQRIRYGEPCIVGQAKCQEQRFGVKSQSFL
jgi:predicted nucleic acid-binding protein